MLQRWSPLKGDAATFEVGIYSACYKLSILITLFVQAFRMGAEPFFFKQSTEANAQRTYARVMKFFVITICGMFLFVSLYLDIWKYFIRDEKMWVGLKVVPILLLANMFLGIYINLSIWYRLSRKTTAGAYITLDRCRNNHFHQFYFYSLFQLYGLRLGYFPLLWNHDGYFLYLGTEILSCSLCMEKTGCIYGHFGTDFTLFIWHYQNLEQLCPELYHRYLLAFFIRTVYLPG